MDRELNEEELQALYAWIDRISLTRPKRHITRDFSDGGNGRVSTGVGGQGQDQDQDQDQDQSLMAAEVVKYFFPKLVDLHNYIPANSTPQKLSNWNLLNRQDITRIMNIHLLLCIENAKVFSKLNFHVPEDTVKRIVLSTAGVIEPVLSALREKIDKKLEQPTDNILDLEYYEARNQEKPHTERHQTEAMRVTQTAGEMLKDEKSRMKNGKPQQTAQSYPDMDPSLRLVLLEKEKAVLALQETVESGVVAPRRQSVLVCPGVVFDPDPSVGGEQQETGDLLSRIKIS
ncbi:Sperm flagellar protein 1 [Liparis tanakae]|uniref:Sperm flagellar protein 1 n=1 Tax=Liparis tanakae TaxID=230148 RepID=A0A4Z2GXK5_9TELE|nr:Sperm flagellar protein 1 [Liparis tanakae]